MNALVKIITKAFLLIILLAHTDAYGQTCVLFGRVTDPGGNPVQRSRIVVRDIIKSGQLIDKGPHTYYTNSNGWFYIPAPQNAKLRLWAHVVGFDSTGGNWLAVPASDSARIDTVKKLQDATAEGLLGIYTSQYGSWNDAWQQAEALGARLLVNSSVTVASASVVTVDVEVIQGGSITVNATLTFYGRFDAPNRQVFFGTTSYVKFALGSASFIRPEWFNSLSAACKSVVSAGNVIVAKPFTIADAVKDTIGSSVTLVILDGGKVNVPDVTDTLVVNGHIIAGDDEAFEGSGVVILKQRNINICWFPGNSLNAKWDAMSKGLVTSDIYYIDVPYPAPNTPGAYDDPNYGWIWGLDGTMVFDDPEQNVRVFFRSPVGAISSISGPMIKIGHNDKVNNVHFPLGLRLIGRDSANVGIEISGAARFKSDGILALFDCDTLMYINNKTDNVETIQIDMLYMAGFDSVGFLIRGDDLGLGRQVKDVYIDHIECDGSGTNSAREVVQIHGVARGIYFRNMDYQSSTGFAPKRTFLLSATAANPMYQIEIANVKSALDTGIVVVDSSGGTAQRISDATFRNIFVNSGKVAVKADWLQKSVIEGISKNNNVIITSNAQDIRFNTDRSYNLITDSGVRSVFNTLGFNDGDPRISGNWSSATKAIGYFVVDTSGSGNALFVNDGSNFFPVSSIVKARFDVTIANDAVYTFSSPRDDGFLFVFTNGQPQYSGVVAYWTVSGFTGTTALIGAGANFDVTTGVLTGTTGAVGKLTVSVNQGTIYIENRTGASRKVFITLKL